MVPLSTAPTQSTAPSPLVAFYRSGDVLRSRSVGPLVLVGHVALPSLPPRLIADWERDIAEQLALEPGDVESLPLARARLRWPDYPQCVQALTHWAATHGFAEDLASSEVALMACRGARYHHDSAQYGHTAFCNLFVSDDKGLDVHFPATGRRIPLMPGVVLLFDTAQPHAVVERGVSHFDVTAFPTTRDCSQVFLTWEIPIEHVSVARALKVDFDVAPVLAKQLCEPQIQLNGTEVDVSADSGQWCPSNGA